MWIEKIVGNLEDKRRYRAFKARADALPAGYRGTAHALLRYLLYFGPSNNPKRLLTMLDDLADLLEQSAADGVAVREVVGADPVEFAEAFLANYPGGSWISRERERLISSIDQAVEEPFPQREQR